MTGDKLMMFLNHLLSDIKTEMGIKTVGTICSQLKAQTKRNRHITYVHILIFCLAI